MTTSRMLLIGILALIPGGGVGVFAGTVSFGSGSNAFSIDFVAIGDPGNPADISGDPVPAGSVAYAYKIAKYEISRDMVIKASDAGNLNLFESGDFGINTPASGLSWNEAARFVNWLNTSQGFSPAYKFGSQPGDAGYDSLANISLWTVADAGFDASNPFRNSLAHYFLPSSDEWYKAAYFNPAANSYFYFPVGSNTVQAVASGTSAGTAVYRQIDGPADITQAGGLSPYGVMGLGGNVWEMLETESDLTNDDGSALRVLRGGAWFGSEEYLSASIRLEGWPTDAGDNKVGFRVASVVPEPSTLLLAILGMAGLLLARRRYGQ